MTVTVRAEHVYYEPVEIVAATHLGKFPNEHDPNILSCTVIEKRRERDGQTYTKRVAAIKNVLPSILRKVESLRVDNFEMEEECWWDRRFRKFSVQCRNLSVTDWVTLNEASLFEPHKQNPNWTHFEQEGTITVHGLGTLGSLIELFGKRFLSVGAQRGISITEKLMAEKSKRITSFWYSEFLFA